MSDSVVKNLPYSIDLDKPVEKTDLHTLFVMGDNQAHRFELEITHGSTPASLEGCAVTGYFTNHKESATVKIDGEIQDGKAVVTLSKPCYTYHGQFALIIQIVVGSVEASVFCGEGFMRRSKAETIIYDDYIVYDVNTLLSQISAMKQATTNAQTAADEANTAKQSANDAADAANEAAEAADAWANAEMTVESLDPGSAPTVDMTEAADGHKIIKVGFPVGDTGATPQITFVVSTGAAGTQVQLEQSGTPEEPVIHLTIPRGDTGAVEGVDYFEGNPSPLGEASPGTANGLARGDHVHPLPEVRKLYDRNGNNYAEITVSDNGVGIYDSIHGSRLYFNTNSGLTTVYDAEDNVLNRLYGTGYKPTANDVGAIPVGSVPAPNLLDNSDWRVKSRIINQRGSTSYTEYSSKYTIDRWRTYGDVIINDGYITFVNDNESGSAVYLYQHFPLGTVTAGKTYTAACLLRDGTLCVGSGAAGNGSFATLYSNAAETFKMKLRANYNGMDSFAICHEVGGTTADILWAALYEGEYTADTLPPYAYKGYTQELLECQRYYYQSDNYTAFNGYKSSTPYFYIPLPTKMIDIPTVTATTLDFRGAIEGEGSKQSATISSVDIGFGNHVRVTCVCDTLTNHQPAVAITTGLAVSAEL